MPAGLSRGEPRGRFSTFGQELYPEASLRAIRLALEIPERAELREAVIGSLKHPSPRTRARIADKLLQRFVEFAEGRVLVTPYLRLASGMKGPAAQQLLLWRVAEVDQVVGAIAREILFPYLVEGRPPKGWTRAAFRVANAIGLFESDRVITRDFISRVARDRWRFQSEPSLTRALRILRQVGLVEPLRRAGGDKSAHGGVAFARAPFVLTLAAFAYCLERELAARGGSLGSDQIQQADFARLFLQEPLQINLLLEQARRAGLVTRAARGGALRWQCTRSSEEELVTRLLALG